MADRRALPSAPAINPPPIAKPKLCTNRPEWIANNLTDQDRAQLKETCHHCLALAQCEAYLEEYEQAKLPIAGIIAGREWGDNGRVTCRNGHKLTPSNTFIRQGHIHCRICARLSQQKTLAKNNKEP